MADTFCLNSDLLSWKMSIFTTPYSAHDSTTSPQLPPPDFQTLLQPWLESERSRAREKKETEKSSLVHCSANMRLKAFEVLSVYFLQSPLHYQYILNEALECHSFIIISFVYWKYWENVFIPHFQCFRLPCFHPQVQFSSNCTTLSWSPFIMFKTIITLFSSPIIKFKKSFMSRMSWVEFMT